MDNNDSLQQELRALREELAQVQSRYDFIMRALEHLPNPIFIKDADARFTYFNTCYAEAFGMKEVRRIDAKDGSFIIVYLEDGNSAHQLELTWMRDMDRPYNLGDNEFHLAFRVDDYEGAHARHEKMGCICYDNPKMGIYFVTDPDGYWLEVLPEKR